MAACFHILSTPTRSARAVRGLSPKALCAIEREMRTGSALASLSVCELRLRFFERRVKEIKFRGNASEF